MYRKEGDLPQEPHPPSVRTERATHRKSYFWIVPMIQSLVSWRAIKQAWLLDEERWFGEREDGEWKPFYANEHLKDLPILLLCASHSNVENGIWGAAGGDGIYGFKALESMHSERGRDTKYGHTGAAIMEGCDGWPSLCAFR